jgi:E3 ubiquitin-protein ligase HUWE1
MGIGHLGHSRSESTGAVPSSPPATACSASESVEPVDRDETDSGVNAFVEFVFAHVNVVNMFVRLKPSVLTGSLSIMMLLPMLLDFENRKSLFRKELSKRDRSNGQSRSTLQLLVKRGQVYSDSFRHLNYRSSDELKAKFSVKFEGEEGADYGGLTREWYLVLSREMLNPDIGLFVPSQGSKLAFQCNPASDVIFANDNFVHFRFVGRIVGKALYDNMLLDAHFTRAMYKAMLRLPISLSDVQDTEPEVFKSLHWLLHNDVSDLDLTFAIER